MACSSDEPRYRLIAKDLQTVSLSFVELSVVRSGAQTDVHWLWKHCLSSLSTWVTSEY